MIVLRWVSVVALGHRRLAIRGSRECAVGSRVNSSRPCAELTLDVRLCRWVWDFYYISRLRNS